MRTDQNNTNQPPLNFPTRCLSLTPSSVPPAGSAWNTCASWCVWAWGATRCCLTGILQAARADATVFAVVRNKQRSTHLQAAIENLNNVHVVEGDIVDYKSMQVWDGA